MKRNEAKQQPNMHTYTDKSPLVRHKSVLTVLKGDQYALFIELL